MKEVIQLNSRDGTISKLELLHKKDGEESKTYRLRTSSLSLRTSQSEGAINFIDPSGGPMISVGSPVAEADGAIVESIDFSEGFGFTVTFK